MIELKYTHNPSDQKRVFDEYGQGLVLHARRPRLKTLIFLIFNFAALRDPEATRELGGPHEVNGARFDVEIVLA